MTDVNTLQFGETWQNTWANQEGIVARVLGKTVWFVSLTGHFVASSFERQSFFDVWKRVRGVPTTVQVCARDGCSNPAFITYSSKYRGNIKSTVVCPLHIPRGTLSKILTAPIPFGTRFQGEVCKKCGEDANEILGEVDRCFSHLASMWACTRCGTMWVKATLSELELKEGKIHPLITDIHKRWIVVTWSDMPDPYRRTRDIYGETVIRGEQPETIYDHLLMDED